MQNILRSVVNILCVHCVTVANGKWPPSQSLQSGDRHGHQAHQVEHDAVKALQGAGRKQEGSLLRHCVIIIWTVCLCVCVCVCFLKKSVKADCLKIEVPPCGFTFLRIIHVSVYIHDRPFRHYATRQLWTNNQLKNINASDHGCHLREGITTMKH